MEEGHDALRNTSTGVSAEENGPADDGNAPVTPDCANPWTAEFAGVLVYGTPGTKAVDLHWNDDAAV